MWLHEGGLDPSGNISFVLLVFITMAVLWLIPSHLRFVRMLQRLVLSGPAEAAARRVVEISELRQIASRLEVKTAELAKDVRLETDARERESEARHAIIAAQLDTVLSAKAVAEQVAITTADTNVTVHRLAGDTPAEDKS